ncbi:Nyv1p Ecym_4294 [Eremothecium cymbalariae DBVPG|uniref:V-SNARE coiled-coil homology domain-containing protein n=1 Tax=Eremothecium cymbalariae (strain CBS 270.75 / DBVPG 7215 / KCTC 17166 / NRRL Y-17582) TaxID=931890 RepID=G8JTK4_ERECY|nr:hypothetical protein Ecym_4294 [Eremothecium cymbalariae DBVPG\
MKKYNVTYVEIVNKDKSTTRCQWFNENGRREAGYGSLSNTAQKDITKDTLHDLVHSVVIPKVVRLKGNKVTKTTVSLIDGYDCYYTTNDDGQTLVCFTSTDIPKILPLRTLTQLKGLNNDDDSSLKHNLETVIDDFHQELLSYHDSSTSEVTEQDLQTILNVMNDNIDKFLQRQERISLLVDQTSQLNQSSFNFQRKAVKIRRKMWWNNVKFWSICGIVTVVSLFLLWVILHL